MTKQRLEAFTDGVMAILITIMVLNMKVPAGSYVSTLRPELPIFFAYALSYVNVGIFWNNHHHMLHATDRINGQVLWANLYLLLQQSIIRCNGATSKLAKAIANDLKGKISLFFYLCAIPLSWVRPGIAI